MEQQEIDAFIAEHPDWYVEDGELVAGFEFADFEVVQKKVKAIMKLAEKNDHHPTVIFGYKTVEIRTVTHDAGNEITTKDFKLAGEISKAM